jgi:hypothetical protein
MALPVSVSHTRRGFVSGAGYNTAAIRASAFLERATITVRFARSWARSSACFAHS